MPLAFFRIGLFAWGQRRRIGNLVVILAASVMVVPIAFAIIVNAAVSGPPLPAVPPARPMTSWVVSQPFGCTGFGLEPARGNCAHFHSGIDLVAPSGAGVFAVLAGIAELLPGGGYGIHVVVHHDGETSTMYAHLLAVVVLTGQPVAAGALLGYEGSTGMSTGAHLHFEVRRTGVPIDPVAVFPSLFGAGGPVSPLAALQPRPN